MNNFKPNREYYDNMQVQMDKSKGSRRRRSREKMNLRTSKKNRLLLKKLQNEILALNKKINDDIKKQKRCKTQSLAKTVKTVEEKLHMKNTRRKNKKPKNKPAEKNTSFFGTQEEPTTEGVVEPSAKEQQPSAEKENSQTEEVVVEPPAEKETPKTEESKPSMMESFANKIGLSTPEPAEAEAKAPAEAEAQAQAPAPAEAEAQAEAEGEQPPKKTEGGKKKSKRKGKH